MTPVESLFVELVESEFGGEVDVDLLEREPKLIGALGQGVQAADVAWALSSRRELDFNPRTGIVRLNGR
jgi:hypothetical protein